MTGEKRRSDLIKSRTLFNELVTCASLKRLPEALHAEGTFHFTPLRNGLLVHQFWVSFHRQMPHVIQPKKSVPTVIRVASRVEDAILRAPSSLGNISILAHVKRCPPLLLFNLSTKINK